MSCQTTNKGDYDDEEKEEGPPPLDADDIELLKAYGVGPYTRTIKDLEDKIKEHQKTVTDLIGIKESDTGLSQPSQWDINGDKQMMQEEHPLQVSEERGAKRRRAKRGARSEKVWCLDGSEAMSEATSSKTSSKRWSLDGSSTVFSSPF
jgi:hypothetical protein